MLSQIRQISDGNFNTVFVKNKEQKFNLDKEIHDLECWQQSRNHVYRKEERELLTHLDKLRNQQEYLHQLDEERDLHLRREPSSAGASHGGNNLKESRAPSQNSVGVASSSKDHPVRFSLNSHDSAALAKPVLSIGNTNVVLPPVQSFTDNRELHRTDAHTNICVVCQLPRRSFTKHGHYHAIEAVCCCEQGNRSESKYKRGRLPLESNNEHDKRHAPQVGQRRHSLMMAWLNDQKNDHKPYPPDRRHAGHGRKSHQKLDTTNGNVHQVHVHVHDHHNHVHHHHGHVHHFHNHGHAHDQMHDHHGGHVRHHQGHMSEHHSPASGRSHIGKLHQSIGQVHSNSHRRHSHPGNQTGDATHTPCNSPHKSTRHSLIHQGHHSAWMFIHDPMYAAPASISQHHHSSGKIVSDSASQFSGNPSIGMHDTNSDSRRHEHELHWDRHQVCKLRGMITDPRYKEQLEVEGGKTYPWSSQYQANKLSSEDLQDLKNCRYLRFSKLNLENMKENPEEEVEVFEKKPLPFKED